MAKDAGLAVLVEVVGAESTKDSPKNRDRVAAIGEIGLDYDRTQFCAPEVQRRYFELQLELAAATSLPLFLHCRAAAADLVTILERNMDKVSCCSRCHSNVLLVVVKG